MTDIYDESKLTISDAIQATTAITQIYTLFQMGKSLEQVVNAIVPESTVVDAELSATSDNPVKNKAIYAALALKADASAISSLATTDLSNVNLGADNSGKTLQVDTDGTIKLVTVE